jgi:rare lipoprotein A
MKNLFTAKLLTVVIAVLSLATVSVYGIAIAQTEEGIANFYSDKFQGRKTASGAVYDKNKLTASHKTLPYGTKVRVTNIENGKSVVVTVNDRMKPGSPVVIDVTRRAAQELGFAKAGKAKVKLEIESKT